MADFRKTQIYQRHPKIAKNPRGAGYWLWKPYYLLQVLEQLEAGDVLLYLDAGVEICGDLEPLVRAADSNSGVGLFTVHEKINKAYTKRDCFVLMNCDEPPFTDVPQSMGTVLIFRKTPLAIDMVSKWLDYASDSRIISDAPNTCALPNYPEFVGHRHDQSILTNLRVIYGLTTFTDPTQFGDAYRRYASTGLDDYRALLNLHRERRPSIRNGLNALLRDRRQFAAGVRMYWRRFLRSYRTR